MVISLVALRAVFRERISSDYKKQENKKLWPKEIGPLHFELPNGKNHSDTWSVFAARAEIVLFFLIEYIVDTQQFFLLNGRETI